MEFVTYLALMHREDGRPPADLTVEIIFPRPDNWADATAYERSSAITEDLYAHPSLMEYIVQGYHVAKIIDPVCECVVQNVHERDPLLLFTDNTCRRCGGPLP